MADILTPDDFERIATKAVQTVADFMRDIPECTVLTRIKLSNGMVVVVGVEDTPDQEDEPPRDEDEAPIEPGFIGC